MKTKQFLFLFVTFLACAMNVFAQSVSLPYYCDFESKTENANWLLNAGNTAKFKNKWVINKPFITMDDDEGNFMYISFDGGVNAVYEDKDNFVIAYRSFNLAAGNYDLAFDWKG